MKLLFSWLLNSLALIITSILVPGFTISDYPTAFLAAVIIGLANTFIRPVLLVLTAPLNLLTLGLFTFVVNAVVLYLVTLVIPGFAFVNFWWAILAAVVLSLVSTILAHLLSNLKQKL